MGSNIQRTTYSMIVARLINEHRVKANISQTQFLDRIGMTQSSWSRINRGLSHFSLEELRLACEALAQKMPDLIKKADKAANLLPEKEGIEVLQTTKASENKSLIPTIIASAVLGFLIARLLQPKQ